MSKKKLLEDFLIFDWETYIERYTDLSYIKSKQEAWYHWINYGKHENRIIQTINNKNEEYIDFDWEFYINTYDDLKHLVTKKEAWDHWIKYGKNENRVIKKDEKQDEKPNKKQDEKPNKKKDDKPNKKQDDKPNKKSYEKTDKKQDEKPNKKSYEKPNKKSYEKTDKKSDEKTDKKSDEKTDKKSDEYINFEWEYYTSNYEDLNHLQTKEEAWKHWINHGKNENRICENIYLFDDFATFDWECYIKNYEDLNHLQTKEEAWKHFIFYGFNEGRKLNNITETQINEFEKIIEYENIISGYDLSNDTIYFKKKYTNCGKHLFGWKGSINYLLECIDLSNSVFNKKYYFDEWIEKLLVWGNKIQSQIYLDTIHRTNLQLITFLHNPPFEKYDELSNDKGLLLNNNDLLNKNIIKVINDNNLFNSISFLYVLSIHQKNYIINNYPEYTKKILSINHPIDINNNEKTEFDFFKFKENKTIYHIGWWLRNFNSFIEVKLPKKYKKIILVKNEFKEHFDKKFKNIDNSIKINYELDDNKYVKIFNNSCIFCDLYDCVANNLVIECIKYNTPIIVKRLPSIEEYLGINYPLFFDNTEDLLKYNDEKTLLLKIMEANLYLQKMDKTPFMLKTFCNKVTYDINKLKIENNSCKLTWLYYLNDENIDIEKYISIFNQQHDLENIKLIILNSISSKIELLEKNKSDNITIINIDNNLNMYEIYNIFIENSTSEYLIFKRFDIFLNNKNYSNVCIDYFENNKTFDIIVLQNKNTIKETDFEFMNNKNIQNDKLNNYKINDTNSISSQLTNENSDLNCESKIDSLDFNKTDDNSETSSDNKLINQELNSKYSYEINDENSVSSDLTNENSVSSDLTNENSVSSDLTNETSSIIDETNEIENANNLSFTKNELIHNEILLQFSQIDIFNEPDKDILWRKSIHSYIGNFDDNFWINCFRNHLNIFIVNL